MMTPANRTLMVMAGGTGGHVYPALAVADALRGRGWDVFWLGTKSGLEARVVPAARASSASDSSSSHLELHISRAAARIAARVFWPRGVLAPRRVRGWMRVDTGGS